MLSVRSAFYQYLDFITRLGKSSVQGRGTISTSCFPRAQRIWNVARPVRGIARACAQSGAMQYLVPIFVALNKLLAADCAAAVLRNVLGRRIAIVRHSEWGVCFAHA